jgi:CIC family chloride channel protein
LTGYKIIEFTLGPDSPALGQRVGDVSWPPGCIIVAVTADQEIIPLDYALKLSRGERVILLAPTRPSRASGEEPSALQA